MNRYVPIAMLAVIGIFAGCTNADYSDDKEANSDDGGGKTSSVNGSISVQAGQPATNVETVNGSIKVDDEGAVTTGETVNGSITLGQHATAKSLETVNGAITLDDGVKVSSDVTTVNGKLTLDKGADVGGRLENVNGTIRLTEAHVGGGIHTTSGDIEIGANSKVEGGIKVERESMGFHFGKNSVPRVVIGPGAVVDGPLTFQRKVNLYVSDSAKIGPVTGAEAVKFSGDRPPG
jgi:DUF4097 and DUF4098 domain-containing protein YvlB